METGKAVYKLLKDSADVGAICADRVFPEMAQQDADAPFVVYTVTDTTPSSTKSGTSKLDTARVELYCIAEAYDTAMDLGIAVRTALDRQSGTISGVEVQSIDFDTSDIEFDPDQRVYVLEQTYDVRVQRTGTANVITTFPGNTFTVEEVDGDPSGAVNKLVFSNGTVTIDGNTATVVSGGGAAGDSYHGRYDTEAETERSGATGNVEFYYTARPDGDGEAESITSDTGVTDTINRTLAYSSKFQADPDTEADWTDYTTQPADNATYATAKAALLAGLNETDATAETRGTLPLSLKMTRTTTSAVTNKLLDDYPGAAAAYSVRKLDKDYTGNCMRVRRSSDEATQDIGFDSNGDVDSAAIASFCSGAYGYVAIWYDQSGNGNNATQSVSGNQPIIYDRLAAAVVTQNGKPAVYTPGSKNLNTGTYAIGTSGDISLDFFAVMTNNSGASGAETGALFMLGDESSTTDRRRVICYVNDSSTQKSVRLYGGFTKVDSTVSGQTLFNTNYQGGGGAFEIRFNGSTATANSHSNTGLNVQAQSGFSLLHGDSNTKQSITATSSQAIGYLQEAVFYLSDQSSNRTGIETDINNYFSVF